MRSRVERALVIDAQLFQSYTFHRGMGKYSLSLLDGLRDKLDMYDKKVLLLDVHNNYLTKQDKLRIAVATIGFTIEYLDFSSTDVGYDKASYKNKARIDEYIALTLPGAQIDYMILSLFEERAVSVFPTECARRYLLVYDIIPLQFFDPYLKLNVVADNYLVRYRELLSADHFFTISGSVASDISLHLGIPRERITPIYGAPIKRIDTQPSAILDLIDKKIILFPSGDDYRKNNQNTVDAFNKFNQKHTDQYTLVITSSFTETTKRNLLARSTQLSFAGNVTEQELAWLYKSAEMIIFPSKSEGLGLPVLEAIEFGKKVVCSDIQAFREIDKKSLFFCDPYSTESIIAALDSAAVTKTPNLTAYARVLKRYAWENTANFVSDVFAKQDVPEPRVHKQKVAVFAPRPDGFSGIGKVVQDQHYGLSRVADVTYFFEKGITERACSVEIRKNYLQYAAECRDPWAFGPKDFARFDRVIYHIGNGEYHVATLVKALALPDQVVLHDTRIKGLFGVLRDQSIISQDRYKLELMINDAQPSSNGEFLTTVLCRQRRIIVHSNYSLQAAQDAVAATTNAPELVVARLPITQSYFVDNRPQDGSVYIAMAGLMTQSKGIDIAESLVRLSCDDVKFKVKIFGFSMLPEDVEKRLKRNKDIEFIQSPSDTRYLYDLSRSDIMLNFRSPYHGETSYSTLEGLRFGKDVIVNNMGWFAELPDTMVHKLEKSEQIPALIKKIASSSNDRERTLKRSKFVEKEHNISVYVAAIIEAKERE